MPSINPYITVKELKAQPVGISFAGYSNEQLTNLILIASDIIERYCRRQFGEATYNETSQTVIDTQGRILITVKNAPIYEVGEIKVWTSGMINSEKLTLDLTYLTLFNDAGYMYFTTSHSPWSNGSNYPWAILGLSTKVIYSIRYTTNQNPPVSIKYACALMVANLLKSDVLFKTEGVVGAKSVESFTSDDYTVKFAQMKNDDNDAVLTPPVRQILDRYASLGQNSF